MHSGSNDDSFLFILLAAVLLSVFFLARDRQVLASVTCERPAEYASVQKVFAPIFLLNSGQVFLQVTVSVGEAMRKKLLVAFILESVREWKWIVGLDHIVINFAFELVLVIRYVTSNSMPTRTFFSL